MESQKIIKDKYLFEFSDGFFTLFNKDEKKIAKFPLSARLTLSDGTVLEEFSEPVFNKNNITLKLKKLPNSIKSAYLSFDFSDDEIVLSFKALANEDFYVNEFEYLRRANYGMSMNDKCFSFTPAPRNAFGHGTTLYKFPCDSSMDGFWAPAPFLLMSGNRFGNISFSLLDMPNSYIFKQSEKLGIIAEKPAGKLVTKKGDEYISPKLLITFPDDEWDALDVYYRKLKEKGCINPVPIENKNYPEWWKRFVVDSYGDQMTQLQYNVYTGDDWASPKYTTEWLYSWLETAERRLGRSDFNIVIDAFWQYDWSIDPYPDKDRFEGLRGFIDYAHKNGHKVLLWIIPFLTDKKVHLKEDEKTLAEQYGVLRQNKDGSYSVDYTHDNIESYMDEFCRVLFTDGDGCMDADGVKLDGPFCIANPENTDYQHPEKGIGAKEALLHYKLFEKYAHKYKSDALINTSIVNPFFEDYVHICRLGDQSVREEREQRAKIASITSPNMLTDSDNVDNSEHMKEDYLAAVVYSVPYLYHTDEFLKGERPDDSTMVSLGKLLSLSDKKPYGRPVFKDYGNWEWETDGKVSAACFDYNTIVIFSGDKTAYVFSWDTGEKRIPLFGHKTEDGKDDFICLSLISGEITTFKYN